MGKVISREQAIRGVATLRERKLEAERLMLLRKLDESEKRDYVIGRHFLHKLPIDESLILEAIENDMSPTYRSMLEGDDLKKERSFGGSAKIKN